MEETLTELVRSGRYLKALEKAKQGGPISQDPERQVVLAELLEYHRKCRRRSSSGHAPASESRVKQCCAGRAQILIANLLRERGDFDSAIEQLKELLAWRGRPKTEKACVGHNCACCWHSPTQTGQRCDSIPSICSPSHRSLGSASASAALHLFVAQVESKKGSVATASGHIRIARSLLAAQKNSWLDGVACIDASCLAFLDSDLELLARGGAQSP